MQAGCWQFLVWLTFVPAILACFKRIGGGGLQKKFGNSLFRRGFGGGRHERIPSLAGFRSVIGGLAGNGWHAEQHLATWAGELLSGQPLIQLDFLPTLRALEFEFAHGIYWAGSEVRPRSSAAILR